MVVGAVVCGTSSSDRSRRSSATEPVGAIERAVEGRARVGADDALTKLGDRARIDALATRGRATPDQRQFPLTQCDLVAAAFDALMPAPGAERRVEQVEHRARIDALL